MSKCRFHCASTVLLKVQHCIWKNTFKSCTVTNIQKVITKCGIYNYTDNGVEIHQRGTVFFQIHLRGECSIFQKLITEGLSQPLDIIYNTEIFIQVNYKHQNVKITLKYYVTQKINGSVIDRQVCVFIAKIHL